MTSWYFVAGLSVAGLVDITEEAIRDIEDSHHLPVRDIEVAIPDAAGLSRGPCRRSGMSFPETTLFGSMACVRRCSSHCAYWCILLMLRCRGVVCQIRSFNDSCHDVKGKPQPPAQAWLSSGATLWLRCSSSRSSDLYHWFDWKQQRGASISRIFRFRNAPSSSSWWSLYAVVCK